MTTQPIDNPHDAVLFCDYWARFVPGEVGTQMGEISKVIRDLMLRLEQQAISSERAEAAKGGAA